MKFRPITPLHLGYLASAIAVIMSSLLLPAGLRAETEHEELLRLRKEKAAHWKTQQGAEAHVARASSVSHDAGGSVIAPVTNGNRGADRIAYSLSGRADAASLNHESARALVHANAKPEVETPSQGAEATSGSIVLRLLRRDYVDPTASASNGDPAFKSLVFESDVGRNPLTFFDPIFDTFRLRKDVNDLKAFETILDEPLDPSTSGLSAMANDKTQTKDSDPASFSYTRDNVKHTDGWKAQGVLYLPMTFVDSGTKKPVSPFFFHMPFADTSWMIIYPAVRFDRDSSKDGTKSPENTLDFLIGADFNFYHSATTEGSGEKGIGSLPNFAYVIRTAAGVRTDFSLRSPHALWEMSMDPVSDKMALNVFDYIKSDFLGMDSLMHKIIMRGLTQVSADTLNVGQVKAGDTTFPLGFQAGFSITPRLAATSPAAGSGKQPASSLDPDKSPASFFARSLANAKLTATYTGVFDAKNDYGYSGLFEADLDLPIFLGDNTKSQAGWTVMYKNGNDLSSHDKVNEVDVALTARF